VEARWNPFLHLNLNLSHFAQGYKSNVEIFLNISLENLLLQIPSSSNSSPKNPNTQPTATTTVSSKHIPPTLHRPI
jgi:uncharacterized membrane protein YgcG